MKVYLAARWEQALLMRMWRTRLCSDGIRVTSRWLDVAAAGLRAIEGDDIMVENARLDFEDIVAADALVCYGPRSGFGGGRGGRHVELGVALGLGRPVVLVGERENIFHWHPSVIVVPEGQWDVLLGAINKIVYAA